MLGGMQDHELRVMRLLEYAEREHWDRELVSRWADGSETRTTWAGAARDARKLAQALERMGCKPGDRIATLAMNHHRHLVAWYGAIGMGGIIHTINPRLFEDQLAFIGNHAEDKVLLYDKAFAPLVEKMKPQWNTIEHYVVFDGDGPDSFEAVIAQEAVNRAKLEGMASAERKKLIAEGMKFYNAPNPQAYSKLAVDSAYQRMTDRLKKTKRGTDVVAKLRATWQR